MKPTNFRYITVLLLALGFFQARAQDPHFSQYFSQPLVLNPAMTGMIQGKYRIVASHRSQWIPLQKPYRTYGVSMDTYKGRWGFGGLATNQTAGDGVYNNFNFLLSGSYNFTFGKSQFLYVGAQAGIIQRSFDPARLTYGSQYEPGVGYNPGISNGENYDKTFLIRPDANIGVMWFDGNAERRVNFFAGASAFHLNMPNISFTGETGRLPMKFNGTAGAKVRINRYLDLTPSFIYIQQDKARNSVIGLSGSYALAQHDASIMLGAMTRINESVIVYAGTQIKNFTVGISYDFAISDISDVRNNKGSFEISLAYIPRSAELKNKFVCPRL